MDGSYIVYGSPGSGSVPVEAALALIGASYEVIGESVLRDFAYNPAVLNVNPLGQVPALVLPGGEVMTESAAILIWLADRYPDAALAPTPTDQRRPAFLRWMAYVATAIYGLAWVRGDPMRIISDERQELLDTGGGIVKALPHLGRDPFFVVNSDSIWIDRGNPALARLRASWDDTHMDCLLLLCRPERTIGYDGRGDFLTDAEDRVIGRPRPDETGLAYIGAYLVHPRLFANICLSKFSMNILWDKAIAERRLYGIEHQGQWLHVGTPDAIPMAERALGA